MYIIIILKWTSLGTIDCALGVLGAEPTMRLSKQKKKKQIIFF